MALHVLTADTFGRAKAEMEGLPCRLSILPKEDQARGKQAYLARLGAERTAAVGNGRNDRLMLKDAALGVCVILEEGACVETLLAADVACPTIVSALQLLMHPLRLTATLRS